MASNIKQMILPIIILMIFAIVITVGYFTFNDNSKDDNKAKNDSIENSSIFDTEKEVTVTEIKKINTFEGSKPTAKSQFKVGETYVYHLSDNSAGFGSKYPCDPVEIDIPIHVEKIERVNKSDYYVLRSEKYEAHPSCYVPGVTDDINKFKEFIKRKFDNPIIYGGCIIGVNDEGESISLGENFGICEEIAQIQQPWMLYLNESVKWIESVTVELDGTECEEAIETITEGTEKINGRDCFKVQRISKSNCGFSIEEGKKQQLEMQIKGVYYIDKQKRITVKYEGYQTHQGDYFLLTKLELKEVKILK